MAKITKETMIHEALKASKEGAAIMRGYQMNCQSCSGGQIETLAWGAKMHGVDPDELVEKLNAAQKKK